MESTERLEDFGEKIGGARKDWRTNGLNIDDLFNWDDSAYRREEEEEEEARRRRDQEDW